MKFIFTALILFFVLKGNASLVYTPQNLEIKKAKIIVVIHGCLQSSESMAIGTGWNKLADKNNLIIIYPQIPEGENAIDCWNWYLAENQRSDSKLLNSITGLIKKTLNSLGDDHLPVFVTGMSSGGAITSALLACFPEMFQAGAVHSGVSFGLAQNITEAQRVLLLGPENMNANYKHCNPQNFKGGLLVLHGKADKVVNPLNAQRIIDDFKFALNAKLLLIDGLDHSWPGFTENLRHKLPGTAVPFFSKKTPNSTEIIWKYFKSAILSPI